METEPKPVRQPPGPPRPPAPATTDEGGDDGPSFGSLLKEARRSRGLSLREFAVAV